MPDTAGGGFGQSACLGPWPVRQDKLVATFVRERVSTVDEHSEDGPVRLPQRDSIIGSPSPGDASRSARVPAMRISSEGAATRFLAETHTTSCVCPFRVVFRRSTCCHGRTPNRSASTLDRSARQDGYLTARQIAKHYGYEDHMHEDVQAMLDSAIARGNVRPHPDCPDREETIRW